MYLAINAILFLCEASIRIATIVSEYTEVEKMMGVAKKVQAILAEHEHLSREYREKFTTPPTT